MAVFSATTTSNKYISIELETRVDGQSIANNTTTITWWLGVRKSSSSTSDTWGNCSYSVNIGGHTSSGSGQVRVSPGNYTNLLSGTVTLPHNADGTMTLSVSGSISGKIVGSVSGNQKMTTIPRASSIAASTFTLGQAGTISINRASSGFTHTIQYKYGSASGTITTKTNNTSVNWTPPISLSSQTPNSTQGTGTLTCYTYSGNTQIGQSSISFTTRVPSSVAPSISAVNVAEAVYGLAEQFGAYVQTKSKLRIKTSASGSYGSSISNCQIKVDGGTYSGTDVTSNPINSAGTVTITATVTDSRGRTASKQVDVLVTAYSPPAITAFTAHRCDAAGSDNTSGDYVYISYAYRISEVGAKNDHSAEISIKRSSANDWTKIADNEAYSADANFVTKDDYSSDYRFDVRLMVTDYFGATTMIAQIPSADTIIDILASGDAVAIGEVAEKPNTLTVAADWTTRLRGGVEIEENPLVDYIIEQDVADIWTYRKWASGTAECWGKKNYGDVALDGTWGSMHSSKDTYSVAFPDNFFSEEPSFCSVAFVPHSSGSNFAMIANGWFEITAARSGGFIFVSPVQQTLKNAVAEFHVIGKWK